MKRFIPTFLITLFATAPLLAALNITIIESQSEMAGHDMDQEWLALATSLGHTAAIMPQTTLDGPGFFPTTDLLIISSGVIGIPQYRRDTILDFLLTGGDVYLTGEYLTSYDSNLTFAWLVGMLGGSFTWGMELSGNLTPQVLGDLATTPNAVPQLDYFWWGVASSSYSPEVTPFLNHQGYDIGFIFDSFLPGTGDLLTASDQDWIRQSDIELPSLLLMENILHYFDSGVVTELDLPSAITLAQNYPNPFNPTTRIAFSLNEPCNVRLTVYDLSGKTIATLAAGWRNAGEHDVLFDGSGLGSGLYLYSLEAAGVKETRRMVLIK